MVTSCHFIDPITQKRCGKVSCYNSPDKKNALYCRKHAPKGMINVYAKKCAFVDDEKKQCTKQPTYNFPDKDKPLYCKIHIQKGMVDLQHKKCLRTHNIIFALKKPVVFIRFNPDKYTIKDKDIKGCFSMKVNSFGGVKPISEFERRMSVLKETITHHINHPPSEDKMLQEIFLFFDE